MAYQFKAIDRDKEKLNAQSKKMTIANNAFGSVEVAPAFENEVNYVEVEKVPSVDLTSIKERAVNEFNQTSITTLKASILSIGLVSPIAIKKNLKDYTIISGHRRFRAYQEILNDLRIEKAVADKEGRDTKEIEEKIAHFSKIPAITYEVVSEDSDLLGTDPKYITKPQEEEMYKATNLESRQITKNELVKHIGYFYTLINDNPEYRKKMLEDRNKNAIRKATKLNLPETISDIISKDLGFNVSKIFVYNIVSIMDDDQKAHREIRELSLNKIYNGESVKDVYDTYKKYTEICDDTEGDNQDLKARDLKLIEKGENATLIYNEYFNIKENKEKVKSKKISIDRVIELLKLAQSRNQSIEEVINEISKL